MNLSTVARVKAIISSKGTAPDNVDAELGAVLATVSGAVEAYLDRYATTGSRTEYLDVGPGQTVFRLRAYPVTALTGAWFDVDQSFGSSTALTSSDYFSPTLETVGLFRLKYPLGSHGARSLKVTYTGGMAATADAFAAAYPDVAGAVDVQTSHEWQRRNALGVTSVSYPDGTSATLSFDRWIPSVKQVLDRYRRFEA